jgi:hypothetical protein
MWGPDRRCWFLTVAGRPARAATPTSSALPGGGVVRVGGRDLFEQGGLALADGEPFGEGGTANGQVAALVEELT